MSASSPPGRGILLAIVTGEIGERIQRWREMHDPEQARRYPPHATLCYWVPDVSDALDTLDAQVRHAFPAPIEVALGGPHIFENPGRTMYVEVRDHATLDAARQRLTDGTHLELPGREGWEWHVTCLRRTDGVTAEVLAAAEDELQIDAPWLIVELGYFVLVGDEYERRRTWHLGRG